MGTNLFAGKVIEQDTTLGRVRVRIDEIDFESDFIPVITPRSHSDAQWWLPEIGEFVQILFDANLSRGVVLGAIYSAKEPPPSNNPDLFIMKFKDGGKIAYDRANGAMDITAKGTITINAASNAIIVTGAANITAASANVTLSGTAHITAASANVTLSGTAHITAASANIDAPMVSMSGDLQVGGTITTMSVNAASVLTGGLTFGAGGSGISGTVPGNMCVAGNVEDSGGTLADFRAKYNQHNHSNQGASPPNPQA